MRRLNGEQSDSDSGVFSTVQDRGGEYRSLLGIPGGLSGALAGPIKEGAAKLGLSLEEGLGGDPDTFMRKKVRTDRRSLAFADDESSCARRNFRTLS